MSFRLGLVRVMVKSIDQSHLSRVIIVDASSSRLSATAIARSQIQPTAVEEEGRRATSFTQRVGSRRPRKKKKETEKKKEGNYDRRACVDCTKVVGCWGRKRIKPTSGNCFTDPERIGVTGVSVRVHNSYVTIVPLLSFLHRNSQWNSGRSNVASTNGDSVRRAIIIIKKY